MTNPRSMTVVLIGAENRKIVLIKSLHSVLPDNNHTGLIGHLR